MQFAYEAMTLDGQMLRDRLTAGDARDAVDALRARGLTVLSLNPADEADDGAAPPRWRFGGAKVSGADFMLFSRQMKMLLEAGAAIVPALEAIERQTTKPVFRQIVSEIRTHVEHGGTLTDALRQREDVFAPVFCSLIAAGEQTANLPDAFRRLSDLTHRAQQVRKQVIGALTYPAALSLLTVGVVCVLLGFVIPRFAGLFATLHSELPLSTKFMLSLSELLRTYWYVPPAVLLIGGGVTVVLANQPTFRNAIDSLLLRMPLAGRILRRLIVARIFRVWAALLRSHVPLLEAIDRARHTVRNRVFLDLLTQIENDVQGGGTLGRTLAESGLVEPTVAAAICIGEDNGRLSEAVEFVSTWLDEDNADLVATATRVVEPAMLALMGLIVGVVALSLFVPLFDLAMAAR